MAETSTTMREPAVSTTPVPILYVNWRGETSVRRIVPGPMWFGSTEWHPQSQWLMTADEPDTGKRRDFAVAGIKAWGQEAVDAAGWRARVEPDPHGDRYDWPREQLCGGHLTDDQVAFQTAMLMRTDLNHEAVLAMAKDRIRWLSRRVAAMEDAPAGLKTLAVPAPGTEEREFWLEAAEQHGFKLCEPLDFIQQAPIHFFAAGEQAVLELMAAAREQGRKDMLAASFQSRVQPWMMACFGEKVAGDREERNHRFLEEALELVQTCGCTAADAHQLVDYVFSRPVGEKGQEVGGVMVTLAALCLAQDLDLHQQAEIELARIWTKVEQIRAKQAAKPKYSPLPEHTPFLAQGEVARG